MLRINTSLSWGRSVHPNHVLLMLTKKQFMGFDRLVVQFWYNVASTSPLLTTVETGTSPKELLHHYQPRGPSHHCCQLEGLLRCCCQPEGPLHRCCQQVVHCRLEIFSTMIVSPTGDGQSLGAGRDNSFSQCVC